ncbi:MAG: bZIP transcription factor AtfA [Benniella sp.]|nr:MAG: bZIP transcription factor AtfA [Benniella sp.]
MAACSKLDMEPNPFEQSFSGSGTAGGVGSSSGGTGETPKPVLPPIAAMSGPLAPNSEQFGWEGPSLRMGPLSPSMLEGPQDPIMFEKPATTSSVPMGSFPATTAPISTIFASVAPMADASFPVVGMSGPQSIPPAGPIQTTAPYPPVVYNQQPMSQQLPQHGPSNVARHPQAFSHTNGQPPMNGRYMPTQGAGAQPADNANGYGANGLHMLNQGPTTTHREAWVKRESIDANGTTILQGAATHVQQALPVMPPGMIAAPQLPKNGVEPAFVRGVQKRMASEDNSSDDSSKSSKHSNGSNGNEKPSKKRPGVEEKMDDEEKRKNFLERNRQAALKCRQRKKQWLTNLQAKVEYLTSDNEQLLTQTAALRDEIIHLKALLLAHKDCPVAQANGVFPDTISGSNNHAHNGNMISHGRTPSHSMQGPPPGQNLQQQRGSRGSLPSQMQTGGARMPMSSGPTGINGQASVRY